MSLPSQLVHDRPDILSAEAQLHAATAAVGVATANLYPTISLSASATQQSLRPEQLFNAASSAWGLIANLTAPLYDGGMLRAERRATLAALRGSSANYQQTVLEAFRQVADLMDALDHDAQLVSAQDGALGTAQNSPATGARELCGRQLRNTGGARCAAAGGPGADRPDPGPRTALPGWRAAAAGHGRLETLTPQTSWRTLAKSSARRQLLGLHLPAFIRREFQWPTRRSLLNSRSSRAAYRAWLLTMLVLVSALNLADRQGLAASAQALKLDLKFTDAQLGLIQGLGFAIFYTLMGLPLARLAERHSRTRIIAACVGLFGVMVTLCSTAQGFGRLLLFRIGVGVGDGGFGPPVASLVGRSLPDGAAGLGHGDHLARGTAGRGVRFRARRLAGRTLRLAHDVHRDRRGRHRGVTAGAADAARTGARRVRSAAVLARVRRRRCSPYSDSCWPSPPCGRC